MRTPPDLTTWPLGIGLRKRVRLDLDAVHEEVFAVGAEVPTAIPALVDVVVLDGVMDPAVTVRAAILNLRLAIDDTGSGVPIVGEINQVRADVQEGDANPSERLAHQRSKRVSPGQRRTNPDIRHVELNQRIDVLRVGVKRVRSGKPTDLGVGEGSFGGFHLADSTAQRGLSRDADPCRPYHSRSPDHRLW